MIEKALIVIIFMYLAGFALVGVQYIYADVLGITLRGPTGIELATPTILALNMANINSITTNIANATNAENSTLGAVENAFRIGFNVGKDLLMLLTGTYVFNILYLVGVPIVFIVPMVIVYVFLLGRQLIALIRGV